MATAPKKVYINGHFFEHLAEEDHFNDRPEFHRRHEHSLWTIYQVLKAEGNTATISNPENVIEAEINDAPSFKAWVAKTYPGFDRQLDQKVYSSHPHPSDKIQ